MHWLWQNGLLNVSSDSEKGAIYEQDNDKRNSQTWSVLRLRCLQRYLPQGLHWLGEKNGLYVPHVNEQRCVGCGLCSTVCPGLGHVYNSRETAKDTAAGAFLECCNAWSRDSELRHVSASGGVVSTMIRQLVLAGKYDGAFCLDSYDYRMQLKTRLYMAKEIAESWSRSNAPKSRYLPVSHEDAVAYMRENRSARLIFVGTSCAVRGLQSAVKALKLDPEQYLFIGLFCDRVFNYNVLSYFQDRFASGTALEGMHFKNKESGGWPGDMKLFPREEEPIYVPLRERENVKAYFSPERCLYCIDKLNACADISLGDNYTGKDASKLGSNSVIIRTQTGAAAWKTAKSQLKTRPLEIGDIQKVQNLYGRLDNLYFGDLKTSAAGCGDLNSGVPREHCGEEFEEAWKRWRKKANAGAVYAQNPQVLYKLMDKKPNPVSGFAERALRYIKRKIKQGRRI